MSVRAGQTAKKALPKTAPRDAVVTGTANRTAAEAEESARRRMQDPAYRVEVDRRRGRGAPANPAGRFEPTAREAFDDGWAFDEEKLPVPTEVIVEKPRTIITKNDSPDISFDRSINPYRGCEHGCAYCFARPTHAFQGLSSGLDFETKIFAKPTAPRTAPGAGIARAELHADDDRARLEHRPLSAGRAALPDHAPDPGGARPDEPSGRHRDEIGPRHPRHRHPAPDGRPAARQGRDLGDDPRPEARPQDGAARRLARRSASTRSASLAEAGIPVTVLVAPIIPAINEHEIEAHPEGRLRGGRARGRLRAAAPAARAQGPDARLARGALPGQAQARLLAAPGERAAARITIRNGASGRPASAPIAWMIGRRFEVATARARLQHARPAQAAHAICSRRRRRRRASCACSERKRLVDVERHRPQATV